MTAFTPPPESWINRYPNQQQQQQQSQISNEEKKKNSSVPQVPGANQLEAACKNYIESAEISVKSHKSLGTDDHFKSMVCSKNLLKVCEKLMTKKDFTSSTNSVDSIFDGEDDFDAELSLMNEKSRMEYYRNKYGNRRDSQSLPASPKMERKNNMASVAAYNPYFTVTKSSSEAQPQSSSISFLTNLFGITAKKPNSDLQTASSSMMTQKTDKNDNFVEQQKASDALATFNSVGDSSSKQEQQDKPKTKMTPQPHQYREMNFWTPTSM